MADPTDLTIKILTQIRDELRTTREELSGRLDQTREELSGRLEETNARLDQVVREQIRQGTALIEQGQRFEAVEHGITKVVDAVVALDHRTEALERGQGQVIEELRGLNARIDHVLTGPLGQQVRAYGARIEDHEARLAALEHRPSPRRRRRPASRG